jgi:hypothetical protein
MAQPEYVPSAPRDRHRVSERLPTPAGWRANRPAEVVLEGGQPQGPRFGAIGPDQGYALKLIRQWEDRIVPAPGEDKRDVIAGVTAVAMRRASLYGRAPVTFDVEVALLIWGFVGDAPPELVAERKGRFEGCAHEYLRQRAIADAVPEATLRLTPAQVRDRAGRGEWRSLLGLD